MWAGPAQINGPASAQKKRLGRPRPKRKLGRSRPNQKFLFSLGQARPRRARLGQHRAGPATEAQRGGRIIFSSPPSACRTILHAGGDACNKKKCRGEESVPGVEEAVAGGAAVEAGGDVVAHGRRLQAALRLFTAVRFVALFSFSKFPPGFKLSPSSQFWVFGGSPLFGCYSLLLSLFGYFFSSLSFLPSGPLFPLPCFSPLLCWVLFIEQVIVAVHCGAWGTGLAAAGQGRSCPGVLPSVSAARRVVGQCLRSVVQWRGASGWSVGSRRERDRQN